MSINVTVREYKTRAQFEREANKLGRQGWEVQTVTEHPTPNGCGNIIRTAGWSLFWPPKPRLIVTYKRGGA